MSQMEEPGHPVAAQPAISTAVLAVGAVTYAIVCVPAINARGYPPLDARWDAVTYLWPAPIFLSAVFADFGTATRKWQLAVYAIFTAFVFEATTVMVVPRSVTIEGTILGTIFLTGPFHLVVTFAFERLCQACLRRFRAPNASTSLQSRFPQISLAVCFLSWTALALTIAFPFVYQSAVISLERSRGRSRADADWQTHRAVKFVDDDLKTQVISGFLVGWYFDPETGLEFSHKFADRGFRDGYNQRISELIAEHGMPKWSLSRHLVQPDALIALLASNDLTEIKTFPHDVTESMVAFRRGTINRWGGSSSSAGPGLSIATPGGLFGVSQQVNKVYVGRVDGDPDVVIVRDGNNWIGLFHRNGMLLMDASR